MLESYLAIRPLAVSTCVREARPFIPMSSYHHRFLPNFSQIAEPVIMLTSKYAYFESSVVHKKAIWFLREGLAMDPLLVYTDMPGLHAL